MGLFAGPRVFAVSLYLAAILFLTSCGAGTVSDTTSDDSGSAVYEDAFDMEGAPVSIPAPISKSIKPIDPTSLDFEESSSVAGTGLLTGKPIDTTTTQTIVAIVNDEAQLFATFDPALATTFKIEIDSSLLAVPVALCVLGSDSSESDVQTVSFPVITTIGSERQNNNELPITIWATNDVDTSTGGDLAVALQYAGMDIANDFLGLSSKDAAGEPVIATLDLNPLTPGTLSSFDAVYPAGTEAFGNIQMTSDGLVLGITEVGDTVIHLDTNSATVTSIATDISGEDYQSLSINPSEDVFIYAERPTADNNYVMKARPMNAPASQTILATLNGSRRNRFIDFISDSKIVSIEAVEGEGATSRIRTYSIAGINIGAVAEIVVTPTEIATTNASVHTLLANRVDASSAFFSCRTAICQVNLSTGAVTELVDYKSLNSSARVKYIQLSEDGTHLAYEIDVQGDDSDIRIDNVVSDYNLSTGEVGCNFSGTNPIFLEGDQGASFVYLSHLNDTLQLSVRNLDLVAACK